METGGIAANIKSAMPEKHSFSANRAAKPRWFRNGYCYNHKDLAKMERANASHISLVNIVATRIRTAGGIAKSNKFIDLASKLESDFIFEMKSTTDANVRNQIRKGISQLYEYRYLQNKPEARLVLVIERPIVAPNNWMNEYLEDDRDVLLVWDGNDQLFGSPKATATLPFLNLNN